MSSNCVEIFQFLCKPCFDEAALLLFSKKLHFTLNPFESRYQINLLMDSMAEWLNTNPSPMPCGSSKNNDAKRKRIWQANATKHTLRTNPRK